jgi:capsular exopolysaccharide synthesis family protein
MNSRIDPPNLPSKIQDPDLDSITHADSAPLPESGVKEHRSGPLKIAYTTTEVIREAALAIRRHPGIVDDQRSPLSDAFKVLRTQVIQRMRAQGWRSLAVTAARASEVKSVATINLALTLAAEFDKTALLVDADLGAPQVSRLFGIKSRKGLRDFLLDDVPLTELIINPGIEHLVVLPAGAAIANSAELLATDASTLLIHELQSRYPERYIIFDAPSALTADALSLFEKVDAVLLVVERNQTTRNELEQCVEALRPFNLMGSVLCDPLPGAEEPVRRPKRSHSIGLPIKRG